MMQGRAWRFGDHINTDLIIPGRYLDDPSPSNLAAHAMEDADPTFPRQVRQGDVIVAGRNFGCGSSREQAPVALKSAGVSAVVAGSFARIFYRNCINVGLPVIICPEAGSMVRTWDVIAIDMSRGEVALASGERLSFAPLPGFLLAILEEGGLVPYTRARLKGR
ncbi:MAG: 3-isopropylmalate dehydratase small subunit [Methanomassiliicoccales archaeon]|jgi:3-isopropylmalate dehydratase small subunit|nr:3-isopropylmalate dehydratase small subunit [Methanomassiliicoccales archaeon]